MPLFCGNRHTPFTVITTAPGAAPMAVLALQRAKACQRTVLAQEPEQPSNPMPAGLERTLRTASVQAPGPAQSPTSAVPESGMKALPQARLPAKARLLRQRLRVARDPPQQRAAVPPAAQRPWGRTTPQPRRQRWAFQG